MGRALQREQGFFHVCGAIKKLLLGAFSLMRRANLLCQGWTKAVSARIMQTEASPFESANTPSRLRRDDYLRKGETP